MLDFERELDDLRQRLAALEKEAESEPSSELALRVGAVQLELEARTASVFSRLTPWQRVQLARHPRRPHTLDYIERIFTDFVELHGDRRFADDPAIVGGLARLDGAPVMIVGHQKGRTTNENVVRNFGMAHPEGYRKALRLFRLAERFHLPVISLLDTPGASPTLADEERGQSWAIAENLAAMTRLRTPIIVVVIGEGGSGGALALGVGDRVLMLEHAVYSVASPEAAAAIIWRDAKFAERAASALRLTADELRALDLIDRVVREPPGGAHRDYAAAAAGVHAALREELAGLAAQDADAVVRARYAKYVAMSAFERVEAPPDA
ncbi:MAG: acetyl-CoA carboxylase carboxyltransferase subunit alpha [Actinobacteria bacterium]|nr:acetyl-CoA carboxylase carboxyltransferase subunit alpha [Actinomycetota bacterium]